MTEPDIQASGGDPVETEDSRALRGRRRRNRQRALIVGGVIAVVVVVVAASALFGGGLSISGSKNKTIAGPIGPPANLTLLELQASNPLAAVVANAPGRDPRIVPVPSNILTALPEQGSGTVTEALSVSGEFARLGISNVLGTWINHYIVIDEAGLSKLVTDRGGLTVKLPSGVRLSDKIYPGGLTKLTGDQVVEYLSTANPEEHALRWEEVLGPLFEPGLSLSGVTPVETDSQSAAVSALARADHPVLATLPTLPGEGGLLRADYPKIRDMLSSTFGIDKAIPEQVIVLNGTPRTSAPEDLAAKLIPAGYRIMAFSDARGFHHQTTLIISATDAALPEAERMQTLLGLGKVFLGGQESGIGEITVVIGKDELRA